MKKIYITTLYAREYVDMRVSKAYKAEYFGYFVLPRLFRINDSQLSFQSLASWKSSIHHPCDKPFPITCVLLDNACTFGVSHQGFRLTYKKIIQKYDVSYNNTQIFATKFIFNITMSNL